MTPADAVPLIWAIGAMPYLPYVVRYIEEREQRDPLQLCDDCRHQLRSWRSNISGLDAQGKMPVAGAMIIVMGALSWPITGLAWLVIKATGRRHVCKLAKK
ncbi:hypothetical protein ETD86_29495 [Nonomuraea turkmeniaca]|uniref:Uncharacterized protein n=1 Tax=Nonomuraea turkmeniaca TaxID=103838 RepID=A0A5S4F9Y8_9ACTN|nr:hypothetical protein [Nonomuraea turkmeniaca]TMR14083.1 hypothetical protein ETD86_29495 [Nonomuraea turkmeniaca]